MIERPTLARLALAGLFAAAGGPATGQAPPAPDPPAQALPAAPSAEPPKAPAAPKPPETWHGHKYPVQPYAPPGQFPILPTGPGYYTLLDAVTWNYRETPPRWPYPRFGLMPPSFAEIDFTYLDKVPFDQRDWAERLKRVPVGEHWLFSTGGDARYRYNYETNSQLSGRNNTYQLFRARAFGDLWYEDAVRAYGEFLYAGIVDQDRAPLARDQNHGDIHQLFADLRLFECDTNPIFLRVGRQELIYGSQRLVSTREWNNVRERFQGVKGFYRSEKWDADLFLTNPVKVEPNDLDSVERNVVFSGAWLTHKPKKGTFLDLYYLNLDNANRDVARGRFRSGAFNISTLGGRYYGRHDGGFLWDVEGAYQFGGWADQTQLAQMFSTNLGWYFQDAWATPTVWAGVEYASGDPDPGRTGQHKTFNQLFAFGHHYFGYADLVGRQNIYDFTVQAYAYPAKWLTAGVQYHVFRLDSVKDALYNAVGAPIRRDPTGLAGNEVGAEIDVLASFHLADRQDVLVSYSRFFPGRFVQQTGPSFGADALYAQYVLRW
jgi:hypothetical protein